MNLELKNISVNLSNKKILKSINLKVKDGEFISLLGASGCGKTTILKTIAGITLCVRMVVVRYNRITTIT